MTFSSSHIHLSHQGLAAEGEVTVIPCTTERSATIESIETIMVGRCRNVKESSRGILAPRSSLYLSHVLFLGESREEQSRFPPRL